MSDKVWTPLELVRWTTGYFKDNGIPSPRLDAEILLAYALGVARIELYTAFDRPVEAAERDRFRELVRERAQKRPPVAYLTGTREFWSQTFKVNEAVLVPRPETETLVRETLAREPRRIAEVGVGSGAISAALALELPEAEIVATDTSPEAVELARENLASLGVGDRCDLRCADATERIGSDFDVLVSNPPYIRTADLPSLPPEVQHEPRAALDGGEDGLDLIRRLVEAAPGVLRPGGWLLLEIGAGQGDAVIEAMRSAGAADTALCPDLAGIDRVAVARYGQAAVETVEAGKS
ncbi:MAG: peptide chain release factor N(5)-glutamine methyltransferase [Deltaproteobacteria bacterium]|nr:peptide chain release factor N(5)-glutamine methyltransferase [Deltaproteobacteria bacterium]MBW2413579.1 peptide chain release factor N(5)-glutamine methyltransferase [Deltaproteobacteria bacterium]